jgi:hypothetical protein
LAEAPPPAPAGAEPSAALAAAAAPASRGICPIPETVKSRGCEGSAFRATYVCAVVSSVTGVYEAEGPGLNVMLFGIITAIVSVGIITRGENFKLPLYGR